MRRRYSASYFLSTGLKSFWRNRFMYIAAIIILSSAMLISGSFTLVFVNVGYNVNQLEDYNEILVYTDLDATDEELEKLQSDIEGHPNVVGCSFRSKEESLEIEIQKRTDSGDTAGNALLERYNKDRKNPLPDTFIVSFDDVDNFRSVVLHVQELDNVLDVRADQEIAKKINQLKTIIGFVTGGLSLLLLIILVVIISNTIKITMKTREEEITIMRYIGATNTFIRLPFVVEACVVATISAAIAFVIQFFAYDYLVAKVTESYGMIQLYPAMTVLPYILCGFALVAYAVCVLSSIICSIRYMKA